jgi:hypothetical protein
MKQHREEANSLPSKVEEKSQFESWRKLKHMEFRSQRND